MKEVRELSWFAPREAESHKGTYGHLLVIGGSLGLTGAAALASEAALRTGAGLVTCACPGHVNPILEVKLTEAMTWPLPITREGRLGEEALRVLRGGLGRYTAAVVGPGLGRHDDTLGFVKGFLRELELPVVVDADALAAFGEDLRPRTGMVLTPHPGEFGRMTGRAAREIQSDRRKYAFDFVRENDGVLVLKGHGTLVVEKDRFYVNETGNPGMATGGAGDVLSGILGALLARRMDPFPAACLAVWLHGRAGDLACESVGEESLTAGDIIRFLPEAIAERKKKRE